ncbi:MAG: polysaccharide pyruvyl transferase family protein [Prevotellaceae bacterium]|jgi:hypothetical protein|nr:polysaccharide pyruvyl transferase family protein [Prevotellaceae bacterium]
MLYGLLTYTEEHQQKINLGDYVQSLAARQFLPRVDMFLNREKLAYYRGPKVKLVMNGWFTHTKSNDWIPSEDIIPLFVAFHINSSAVPYVLSEQGIAYLKAHAPIGCRDYNTVSLLQDRGIEAYYTGCMTLTLSSYQAPPEERTDEILFVEPLYNFLSWHTLIENRANLYYIIKYGELGNINQRKRFLRRIIDKEIRENAVSLHQMIATHKYTEEEKFQMAETLLRRYARARAVITSRIHCALPCLGMETPMVFLDGFTQQTDTCRFAGITDMFYKVSIKPDTEEYQANFPLEHEQITRTTLPEKNLGLHYELAASLRKTVSEFINEEIS